MIKRPLAMALALLQAVLPGAYAQHSHTRSSITGRVITSVGQPVADAGVALVPAGAGLKSGRGGKTNDEGKFLLTGSPPVFTRFLSWIKPGWTSSPMKKTRISESHAFAARA